MSQVSPVAFQSLIPARLSERLDPNCTISTVVVAFVLTHKRITNVEFLMPSIPLLLPPADGSRSIAWKETSNPLPNLLQTPSGLAILEIQGKINLPAPETSTLTGAIPIGRLVFPHYRKDDLPTNTIWMKTVYLYVGRYQRLTGEVKKLAKPLAVIRRRGEVKMNEENSIEELEVVELVYHKIVFSSRPEPVGDTAA